MTQNSIASANCCVCGAPLGAAGRHGLCSASCLWTLERFRDQVRVRGAAFGLRVATWGRWRILAYPEGGYTYQRRFPEGGWNLLWDDRRPPRYVERLLCAVLDIPFTP